MSNDTSAVKRKAEAMFIDIQEGLEIMRKCEASRAEALAKNRRRVTVDSGGIHKTKRAKRAAPVALSDDNNGIFFIFSSPTRLRRAIRRCHCLPRFLAVSDADVNTFVPHPAPGAAIFQHPSKGSQSHTNEALHTCKKNHSGELSNPQRPEHSHKDSMLQAHIHGFGLV